MSSSWTFAQRFLTALGEEEKILVFNDLLMIEKVHQKNQDEKYYSLRKIRRASRRRFDDRMKVFRFANHARDEIVIRQIQEQHFLKTNYKLQIFFNNEEADYLLIEELLTLLKQEFQLEERKKLEVAVG